MPRQRKPATSFDLHAKTVSVNRELVHAQRREQGRRALERLGGWTSRVRASAGGLVHSLWLVVGLIAVFLVLILVPALRGLPLVLALEKPAFPSTGDLDAQLYRVVVPEEAPRPAANEPPVVLPNLAISQYTTRAGDSLSQIAVRCKLNIDTLISWNGIRDARAIPAGTRLEIPNANGLKYRVRRGDTLEEIAHSRGIALNSVLDWNRLSSSVITVGQELFLPGARMSQNEINRILGSLFSWPVRGRISSRFGERPDPFTGVRRYHNGVDIVNRSGTPVIAAMGGVVGEAGFNNNFGRFVILRHSGYQTLYGHLTRFVVVPGQKVAQGQKIGELGSTGYSTGPHLHFSIFRNGEPIDPLRFLK